MFDMTVMQLAAKFKMPVSVIKKWREDGELDGVKHPSCKIFPGGSIRYKSEEIAEITMPKDNYFKVPEHTPEVWCNSEIRKHGVVAMLACAIKEPLTYRRGSNDLYLIEATSRIEKGATVAYMALNKYSGDMDKIKRMESKHNFPGVQFTVKRVK